MQVVRKTSVKILLEAGVAPTCMGGRVGKLHFPSPSPEPGTQCCINVYCGNVHRPSMGLRTLIHVIRGSTALKCII